MTRRFIVDLIDSDETDRFVGKYGADEITNMTNGDVMKAMFPDIEFTEDVHYDLENGRWVEITDDKYNMTFDETWWNAPYKSESDKSADTFEKLLDSGFYERFRKEDKDADCD